MMFDDRFHPLESNEYDEEDYHRYDKADVGLGFIKKKEYVHNKYKDQDHVYIKTKNVPVYASGCAGSIIRNALTGARMTGTVGCTDDEKQYFKVKYLLHSLKTLNGSQTLFFETEKDFRNIYG
jgi:hypothetical protein